MRVADAVGGRGAGRGAGGIDRRPVRRARHRHPPPRGSCGAERVTVLQLYEYRYRPGIHSHFSKIHRTRTQKSTPLDVTRHDRTRVRHMPRAPPLWALGLPVLSEAGEQVQYVLVIHLSTCLDRRTDAVRVRCWPQILLGARPSARVHNASVLVSRMLRSIINAPNASANPRQTIESLEQLHQLHATLVLLGVIHRR